MGGNATSGNGGNGGEGGIGQGGGISNTYHELGPLTIDPELGATKGSKQALATDEITGNEAQLGEAGTPGKAGLALAASAGQATQGSPGTVDTFTVGIGGGIATWGTAKIDNTAITGNFASTNDNDIDGTFSK